MRESVATPSRVHVPWTFPVLRMLGPRHWAGLLMIVLCFGFLGTRSIWDPDEGRYTNVALTMLDSGNWVDPMRSEHTGHWTKPPLTYWLLAASMGVFGVNPWAARLPLALAYLACMLWVGVIARRLPAQSLAMAPRRSEMDAGTVAGWVYASMLLPMVAGQLITTDFIMTAFQTLGMVGYVRYRFDLQAPPWHGALLMGLGFALAFLSKGPPALLPLLAVVAMAGLAPRPQRAGKWAPAVGALVFLAVTTPWFITVALRHPGLLDYFVGAEVVDRVASDRFGRNGEWYGWLKVYLPTLLLGTLPWTGWVMRWIGEGYGRLRAALARRHARSAAQDAALLLVLWVLLPLLVFALARSRLPLYLLPLWAPLAIAVARARAARGLGLPRLRWMVCWVVVLMGLRLGAAYLPTHKDAAVWAQAIRERATGPVREVIFIEDMARYGLHLHLGVEVEKVSEMPVAGEAFNPEFDEALLDELNDIRTETGLIFITKRERWAALEQRIEAWGFTARSLGTPIYDSVMFEVKAATR